MSREQASLGFAGYPLRRLRSIHAATNDCLGSCADGLSRATAASRVLRQQPQAPEARVPLAADHQVIVDGDAECLCRGLDLARHLDVVARRLGIAGRMVVHLASQNSNVLILLRK